jgi:hypothetical protein
MSAAFLFNENGRSGWAYVRRAAYARLHSARVLSENVGRVKSRKLKLIPIALRLD